MYRISVCKAMGGVDRSWPWVNIIFLHGHKDKRGKKCESVSVEKHSWCHSDHNTSFQVKVLVRELKINNQSGEQEVFLFVYMVHRPGNCCSVSSETVPSDQKQFHQIRNSSVRSESVQFRTETVQFRSEIARFQCSHRSALTQLSSRSSASSGCIKHGVRHPSEL